MKNLFISLAFLTANLSMAATITVHDYRYTANMGDMIQNLNNNLKIEAKKICPHSQHVNITSPEIKFSLGSADIEPLEGYLVLSDLSYINFPSHPYATLTADVECQ